MRYLVGVVLGILVGGFLLSDSVDARPELLPPPGYEEVPRYQAALKRILVRDENWVATATIDVDERRVLIDWTQMIDAKPGLKIRQMLPTAFYPTASCTLSGDRIVVAGRSALGPNTSIELWKIRRPKVMFDPEKKRQVLVTRPVRERTPLFEGHEPGKRLAVLIFPLDATKDFVLVRFADSNDIHELDLRERTMRLIYAGARPWHDAANTRTHSRYGRMAFLGSLDGTVPLLGFFDSDQDGRVDYALVLDEATEASMGLDDMSQYSEY
jgi:hypothetical protein